MAVINWKSATGVSFLLVLILSLLFLYAQSFSNTGIFKQDTEEWNKIITGYLVIFAISLIGSYILAKKTIIELAKASYWRSFVLRFLPIALVSIITLILLKGILRGPNSIDLLNSLSYINFGVLIFHLLVVSQIEELLFGGLIYTTFEKRFGSSTANISSALLFSAWHFSKAGGSWVILLTYIPLRLAFNYIRNYGFPGLNILSPTLFGHTRLTQQANAGAHFGWNAFLVIFINRSL